MAEQKRILIVDDHYDTLRFLRTMLETADERFKVTSVLSGEEAGLELRQPYHLLITDVKLPGVDGIQVAQRARRLSPDMPVIVMTGFPKEIIRLEEAPFDVFRAFRKPLIAEEMLEAVYIAIFGEPPQPPEPETPAEADTHTAEVEELIIDSSVPAEVHKRLELLRNNTGAEELMLATLNGDISAESGILDISLPAIAATMANNLRGSFALADQLGTAQGHQSIQYHNTDRFDLYTANVGEYHFITMFFDASKARRGRIGTVWVFIQRAIKDLEPLLTHVKVRHETKIVEVLTEMPPPPQKPKLKAEPKKVRDDFARAAAITREDESKPVETTPAPAPAFYVPPPTVELEPLSEADMAKLAALDVGDDSEADDFWSTAAQSAESAEPLTSGVTFEEALRQGMLPKTLAEDSPLATLLEETDLAPGTDIPPALLAEADDVADMTLDLGPLDDGDDFDLSGMPGFDFDAGDDALQELGDEAETRTRPLSDDDMAKLANLEISDTAVSSEVEAFWNALMTGDTAQGTRPDGLTLEEALAQGIEIEEHLGKPVSAQPVQAELSDLAEMLGTDGDDSEALDADSFWDEVADDSAADDMAGMTLEEAIRKGLIPSNFNLNDE